MEAKGRENRGKEVFEDLQSQGGWGLRRGFDSPTVHLVGRAGISCREETSAGQDLDILTIYFYCLKYFTLRMYPYVKVLLTVMFKGSQNPLWALHPYLLEVPAFRGWGARAHSHTLLGVQNGTTP